MVFDETSGIIDEEHEIDIGISPCVARGVGADQAPRLDPFLLGGPGDNLVQQPLDPLGSLGRGHLTVHLSLTLRSTPRRRTLRGRGARLPPRRLAVTR